MGEADWLRCAEPLELLEVAGELSERKWRLLAVACCRRIWRLVPEGSRREVEMAERYADGLEAGKVLRQIDLDYEALHTATGWARAAAAGCLDWDARQGAWRSMQGAHRAALYSEHPWSHEVYENEKAIQSCLVRDLVGDPCFPVIFEGQWRTRDVVSLAEHIYRERDFATLPILADALQDAGCDDPAVLCHCEQPHHARGCWLLDRVLRRK